MGLAVFNALILTTSDKERKYFYLYIIQRKLKPRQFYSLFFFLLHQGTESEFSKLKASTESVGLSRNKQYK